jgi:transposase InsO family protein
VKLHLEEGFSKHLVAEELGVSFQSVQHWVQRYRQNGEQGLDDQYSGPAARKLPVAVRDKILELKKEEPTRGVKRISQLLRRIFFLRASTETVRQTLKQEGLVESPPKPRRNDTRPRFFERATPNQMWQTDIFTFRLGGRNAYIIAFLDDYSRYIVGADLFRSHTAENVLEVFRVAAAEYQPPKEMLTDNGREYVNWRGVTRFQAEMKKNGIHHFKSRPHHPMTLGKVERFWATLWQEFLSRAQFENFESARERIKLWVRYYNHKRPHQGIEGLCPADRYFEVASQLRKTIESGIKDNLLEMALRGQPQAPFYMVGRMEGQSVILRAEKGKLKLSVDNGTENKELTYDIQKDQTTAHTLPGLLSPGQSPSGAGSLDGSLQSLGGVPPVAHPVHDPGAVATPGDGGHAASLGIEGQPGQGGSLESETPGSHQLSAKQGQFQEDLGPAGANPACQHPEPGVTSGVDEPLPETRQPDPSGSSRADDRPSGGSGVGHLTPGVLQVGTTGSLGSASVPGGSTSGPTPDADRLGEGPASPAGGTAGKESSTL